MRRRILCLVIASVMLVTGCGSKPEEKGKAEASGVDANGNFINEAVLNEIPEEKGKADKASGVDANGNFTNEAVLDEIPEYPGTKDVEGDPLSFSEFDEYSGELSDELGYEMLSYERVSGGGYSNVQWFVTLANTSNKAFEMEFTANVTDASGSVVAGEENNVCSVVFPSGGQSVGTIVTFIYTGDDYSALDDCTLNITPVSMIERPDVSGYTDSVEVLSIPTERSTLFDVGFRNNGDAENVNLVILVAEDYDEDGIRSVSCEEFSYKEGEWLSRGAYSSDQYNPCYWADPTEGYSYYGYAYRVD